MCAHCQQAGRIAPAAEVNRIILLEHGATYAENNLQTLCMPCHSKKTAYDGDRWRTVTHECC
ncbi:HNH endonuclease [Actinobaculum suis]|uniref:HNH endonuclease n=1 Tax=Actinobaculum suis TaxID=1657 RepID=UPI001C3FFFF4